MDRLTSLGEIRRGNSDRKSHEWRANKGGRVEKPENEINGKL